MKTLEEQTDEVPLLEALVDKYARYMTSELSHMEDKRGAYARHAEKTKWFAKMLQEFASTISCQWQARCEKGGEERCFLRHYNSQLLQQNTALQRRIEESKSKRVKRLEAEISQLFIELGEEKILSAKLGRRVERMLATLKRMDVLLENTESMIRAYPNKRVVSFGTIRGVIKQTLADDSPTEAGEG